MKLEFNWSNGPILTPAQVAKLERDATKWCEANLENGEYIVCDDATANACAKDYITETLWAFNASFLAGETGLDENCFKPIQDKLSEDANPAFLAMIKGTCGLDPFIASAIQADGRGHFLSPYDGAEHEFTVFINRKRVWLYAYRTN